MHGARKHKEDSI